MNTGNISVRPVERDKKKHLGEICDLRNFNICRNLRVFSAKSKCPKHEEWQYFFFAILWTDKIYRHRQTDMDRKTHTDRLL